MNLYLEPFFRRPNNMPTRTGINPLALIVKQWGKQIKIIENQLIESSKETKTAPSSSNF